MADASVDDLLEAARERGVPMTVFDPGDDKVRVRYDAELALVGPDGHVVWRGNTVPSDCLAIIDRIRGA